MARASETIPVWTKASSSIDGKRVVQWTAKCVRCGDLVTAAGHLSRAMMENVTPHCRPCMAHERELVARENLVNLPSVSSPTRSNAQLQQLVIERYNLVQAAQRDHPRDPRYAGMWDGPEWRLVRLRSRIVTPVGRAFYAGDVAIAKATELDGQRIVLAYSRANRDNVAVHPSQIVWLT